MNKRLEEKLAMLAFGDMSPEEVTRLEQEVLGDREASLVLEQYRGMRSGLRAMADIPEHQLSTERLRNAVLNQGLKPRSRPQLGWLWMPTMAAALAFGFVFIRNAQNSALNGLPSGGFAKNDAPRLNALDVPGPSQNVFAMATATGQILSVQSEPEAKVASYSRSSNRSRAERERIAELMDDIRNGFLNQKNMSMKPAGSSSEGIDSAPAAVRSAVFDGAAKERTGETIILIDGAQDSSTGAQKAKEVDRKSNDVVVGG